MILVTGATGFIGGHLVERLLARRERVRVLVRKSGPFEKSPVEVVRGDLLTGDGLPRALAGVDTVIHLAGVTKALTTADYYCGNVRATENLSRAIATVNATSPRPLRTVHVSSLAAIGPSPDGTPILEDAEPHPIAHYGRSKLEGERKLRTILPDAVIVRPPAVYGPRDTDVFEILKSVNQGLVIQAGSGEKHFSVIYVMDLVDGIIAAAREPRAVGRAYFLASPHISSWSELIGIAARIMGRSPRMVTVPVSAALAVGFCAEMWARLTRRPGIISRDKVAELQCPYWVCDTRRAKAELGFEAVTGIEQGLENTLSWYREAGWLKY